MEDQTIKLAADTLGEVITEYGKSFIAPDEQLQELEEMLQIHLPFEKHDLDSKCLSGELLTPEESVVFMCYVGRRLHVYDAAGGRTDFMLGCMAALDDYRRKYREERK